MANGKDLLSKLVIFEGTDSHKLPSNSISNSCPNGRAYDGPNHIEGHNHRPQRHFFARRESDAIALVNGHLQPTANDL